MGDGPPDRRGRLERKEVQKMRPNPADKAALKMLLDDESLSDWAAEFVESLHQWRGEWTEKQANKFDELVEETYG